MKLIAELYLAAGPSRNTRRDNNRRAATTDHQNPVQVRSWHIVVVRIVARHHCQQLKGHRAVCYANARWVNGDNHGNLTRQSTDQVGYCRKGRFFGWWANTRRMFGYPHTHTNHPFGRCVDLRTWKIMTKPSSPPQMYFFRHAQRISLSKKAPRIVLIDLNWIWATSLCVLFAYLVAFHHKLCHGTIKDEPEGVGQL